MENLAADISLGSKSSFSFQFKTSYRWYSMENLTADILLGSKSSFSFQFIITSGQHSRENLAGDFGGLKFLFETINCINTIRIFSIRIVGRN